MLDYLQEIIDSHELSGDAFSETANRLSALEYNLERGLCTEEGAIEALTSFCEEEAKQSK